LVADVQGEACLFERGPGVAGVAEGAAHDEFGAARAGQIDRNCHAFE
jgi:hypothetical protein